MKALVVYESMFGNTRSIAEAVATGLATHAEVGLVQTSEAVAQLDADLDLLVVGGPTHAFGLSRQSTRASAVDQGATGVVAERAGLREWLDMLGEVPTNLVVAAFDTRLSKPRWMTGSAARGAAKRLRQMQLPLVTAPESFIVAGTSGPLQDGEVERARRWGEALGAQLAKHRASAS